MLMHILDTYVYTIYAEGHSRHTRNTDSALSAKRQVKLSTYTHRHTLIHAHAHTYTKRNTRYLLLVHKEIHLKIVCKNNFGNCHCLLLLLPVEVLKGGGVCVVVGVGVDGGRMTVAVSVSGSGVCYQVNFERFFAIASSTARSCFSSSSRLDFLLSLSLSLSFSFASFSLSLTLSFSFSEPGE